MDIQLKCNRLNNRNNRQTKGNNCFFNKILIITLGFLHHLPNHNMASLLGLRTFYKVKSLKQDLTEAHTDKHKNRITSIIFFCSWQQSEEYPSVTNKCWRLSELITQTRDNLHILIWNIYSCRKICKNFTISRSLSWKSLGSLMMSEFGLTCPAVHNGKV